MEDIEGFLTEAIISEKRIALILFLLKPKFAIKSCEGE